MESPVSCAAFQGVFSKSFLHLMLYTVKKCVVCPSPVRMSSTPWIITLFLDQGVLDILAKGRENRTFFLQCISLLRVFYYLGSVVVKFEQGIVVILCTKILKAVFKLHYYRVCIKSKHNLKMHSGSGTPPLQSHEKKIGIFFPAPILWSIFLGFQCMLKKRSK